MRLILNPDTGTLTPDPATAGPCPDCGGPCENRGTHRWCPTCRSAISPVYTAGQFAGLQLPNCPVCDAQLTVDRIDVTPNAEYEAAHGRAYIPGLADCPHHCDIPNRQRRHYGQSARHGPDLPAGSVEVSCTCGDTRIIATQDEGRAWSAEHRRDETTQPLFT